MAKVTLKNEKDMAVMLVNGSATTQDDIALSDLAFKSNNPNGLIIDKIQWSVEDGQIVDIKRGASQNVVIIHLSQTGELDLRKDGLTLSEEVGTTIRVVGQNAGKEHSVILSFKTVSYTHLTLPTIYSV